MAKKTKKRITINAFEKVMKENYQPIVEVEWNGLTIEIKRTLSLQEVISFVEGVADACFDEETGDYLPEVKDFLIKSFVLEKYANFTMPSNSNSMYELIYCTDAFATVMNHINTEQFGEIEMAIDDKLDYKTNAGIEAMNKQMATIFSSFEDIEKNLSQLFSSVDNESVAKLVEALGNGKIDEEKLVKAYLEEKEPEPEQPKIIPIPAE